MQSPGSSADRGELGKFGQVSSDYEQIAPTTKPVVKYEAFAKRKARTSRLDRCPPGRQFGVYVWPRRTN
jgi:hypothetical protein